MCILDLMFVCIKTNDMLWWCLKKYNLDFDPFCSVYFAFLFFFFFASMLMLDVRLIFRKTAFLKWLRVRTMVSLHQEMITLVVLINIQPMSATVLVEKNPQHSWCQWWRVAGFSCTLILFCYKENTFKSETFRFFAQRKPRASDKEKKLWP